MTFETEAVTKQKEEKTGVPMKAEAVNCKQKERLQVSKNEIGQINRRKDN